MIVLGLDGEASSISVLAGESSLCLGDTLSDCIDRGGDGRNNGQSQKRVGVKIPAF